MDRFEKFISGTMYGGGLFGAGFLSLVGIQVSKDYPLLFPIFLVIFGLMFMIGSVVYLFYFKEVRE